MVWGAFPLKRGWNVTQSVRASREESTLKEIFDRILDGCLVFDPLSRFLLNFTNFSGDRVRVVVAPERRDKPFTVA